ncbi:MAG: LemA family protein [Burkholderiaceae bacterium]|jgi:LemA protein
MQDPAYLIGISGVTVISITYSIMLYNNLVQVRNNVAKAWSNIEVLLKQRHDELPKLVTACSEFMEFEQGTLQKITDARSLVQSAAQSADLKLLGSAEYTLKNALGNLFAVAENYPELKSNQHFTELQKRISALEDGIADRREFYNESVNINNTRIDQIPEILFARLLGFRAFEHIQIEATEKQDVDIKRLFQSNR